MKRGQSITGKSRFDRRPCIVSGNVAKIELGNSKGFTVIDKRYSHLDKYNWSLAGDGYPVTAINGKLVKLHHMILGKPPKGLVTDHINRDKLDNRKRNLRFVTQKVNLSNIGMLSTNTSGYKGVTWDKYTNKWIAQGSFNGRHQWGGSYLKIEDAVRARRKIERKYKTDLVG